MQAACWSQELRLQGSWPGGAASEWPSRCWRHHSAAAQHRQSGHTGKLLLVLSPTVIKHRADANSFVHEQNGTVQLRRSRPRDKLVTWKRKAPKNGHTKLSVIETKPCRIAHTCAVQPANWFEMLRVIASSAQCTAFAGEALRGRCKLETSGIAYETAVSGSDRAFSLASEACSALVHV